MAGLPSAVDHKPKRTAQLRRLDDIESAGSATVLVDHYDEDWSRLWWIRVHGRAEVHREHDEVAVAVHAALTSKYTQYDERPPTGAVYRIAIDDIVSWRPPDERVTKTHDRVTGTTFGAGVTGPSSGSFR